LGLGAAALGGAEFEFDGDEQIRRRSAGPLLAALSGLGVSVRSAPGGCAPIIVKGPWKGGRVSLPSPTSQYLSALLLAAPLAPRGTITEVEVPLLNERPYIEMTLSYLDAQGVPYETREDFSFLRIPGGAAWKPLGGAVSGDFSSAAFPGAAAALRGGPVTLLGLDPGDTQGDKVFFDYLREMGCEVRWEAGAEPRLNISRSGPLRSGVFDLNATPDLLPVMAALGAAAAGTSSLVNAAHARIKETDRIAGMAEELAGLGVKTEERPDGLVIHGRPDLFPGSSPSGGPAGPPCAGASGPFSLNGRGDHRVVMALGVLALAAPGPVEIEGAESAAVTYPGFLELLKADIIG
jgi:3-phosphoshikimate 1-carboxyvinyltransferase